jgi:tRNA pseudouridine55 synthase
MQIVAYAWPDLELVIDCGRGTYVRSIARDIGERLDVGGYLASLERTRVGPFGLDRAWTLEGPAPDESMLLDLTGIPVNVR